ncbi:hypothetical protein C2845_PM01G41050 [Panicum miliaceum]|uniref:Uncharacterized protein n=1 Tax=Panicum miliaceum TaxID=4540 RepID=A0A3L6TH97_PANMI|nr:hypothetical protein C2845_PM01G41050 [Panicum miliaceum]
MEGSESSRSRSNGNIEDSIDAMGSWKEDDEREDADGRKSQSGKARKHGYADRVEDPDDARRGSSTDRNESTRKSVSCSAQAYSGDQDDYDVRRDSRVSKVPRRSPEEKSEKDGDNNRRRREDENDWDSDQADGMPSSGQSNHKNAQEAHDHRDGSGQRDDKHRTTELEEKDEYTYESNVNLGTKGKFPYLDDGANAREQSINMNEKTRDDFISHRGRERNKEAEESREYMRNHQREYSKGTNDNGTTSEWSHGHERLDGGSFQGRSAYRKDSRGRYESSKGPSSYGNRYDSSDSIEIRPNRNLDFGRESSVSGRRTSMTAHQDLTAGTNDTAEDDKRNYRSEENSKERYYDDAHNTNQNTSKGSVDIPIVRAGLKGPMTSDTPVAVQSGSSSLDSPIPQQGSKGGRLSRGIRGRPNGRDSQRMGGPVPMMPPPPFGPLGLPPGPMQPMGPNMSHSPSPLGPGIFMPPFPGPLVWAGGRGMDVNMLSVPPNLLMPPLAAGPGFSPSVGAGPSHNIQFDQTTTGRGGPTDALVPGFNPMATPSHEMLHDKPPGGWTPQRNSGPARKAPSRGEQNDYSQNFVDTGLQPQNFIRELELTSIVEDYPKLAFFLSIRFPLIQEHCLMGIKGTVRCSTDGHIIHANIDTDIIIAEEPTDGSTKKPEDMYRIIEHFALGRRRLELFGEDHNIRPGWLTLGKDLSTSNFNKEAYIKNFADRDGKVWQGGGGRNPPPEAPHLVVTTPEIESLRPKSPQKNQQSIPTIGSSSSTNRRPGANTPQNVVTVVGSETMMPAP